MAKQALLKVWANPFHGDGPDHEGRCHARLPYEPNPRDQGEGTIGRWVGCRLVTTELRKADDNLGIRADHDHAVEYAPEASVVEDTPYYRKALREHALFAADEVTQATVFGTKFRDPLIRMARLSDERSLTPALQATTAILNDHAAALAAGKPAPERDRDAEWAAFVGPARAKQDALDKAAADAEAAAKKTTAPAPKSAAPSLKAE